ncbi:RluA family pseudouridine synthase [Acetobacteraceae bacterium ESL0709]|nr:RluA family pseudouridine synthase [Acetobacteraceae bacterium ESL0697]MDF7678777.1 RluA family pseudouridine synthase [Acetobacteraceae bacterium ESL0709]
MSAPPLFLNGKELPILWEDRHFLVINKPSGLASHPGPHTQDSVETRLTPQKRGGPWLVHRLDRDTSGCLLIARRKTALIAAQKAFEAHHVHKTYWAIVNGHLPAAKGEITTPLKRIQTAQGWAVKSASPHDTTAQKAHTLWRVLGTTDSSSWVELQLLTGRTHQARVHLASLGTPIIGDPIYGQNGLQEPLQLLSRSLNLTMSFQEIHIDVTAPPPATMEYYLARFQKFSEKPKKN